MQIPMFTSRGTVIRHGTTTTYEYHKCRCEPCVLAYRDNRRNQARRMRRLKIASGQVRLKVPVGRVKAKVEELTKAGIPMVLIAKTIGRNNSALGTALKRQKFISPDTADAILALDVEEMLEKMPNTPKVSRNSDAYEKLQIERLRRRRFSNIIRWMYANGFEPETLAERLGLTPEQWQIFIHSDYEDNRVGMRLCRLHHVMRLGE